MTKREKVLRLVELTCSPFDKTIDEMVEQYRAGFEQSFGGAKEGVEAIAVIEKSMRAGRGTLEEMVVEAYSGIFSEEEVDALVAFHESPIGKKLNQVGAELRDAVMSASSKWSEETIKSVDGDLTRVLGNGVPVTAAPSSP